VNGTFDPTKAFPKESPGPQPILGPLKHPKRSIPYRNKVTPNSQRPVLS